MIQKRAISEVPETNPLAPDQQALLEELQQMYSAGCQEIPPEFIARFDQIMKWSYDDPASMNRSVYFAARDPYLQREIQAINREFACTEGDGLEEY